VVESGDPDAVLPAASMGKVLLLVTVAAGGVPLDRPLARTREDAVADSGLWRHLAVDALPAGDLAVLVGAVSDNLATNVLLRAVGLDAVRATGAALGLRATGLHDRVRDHRGPEHQPALSTASAAELSRLFADLAAGRVVSPEVSARVLGWLALNTDLSMVASAFGLDPLAHAVVRNKTGTDEGVRADAGVVEGPGGAFAYAALAAWDGGDHVDAVLAAMRALGERLRAAIT
jgi:beta-lactamase class A